jgi:hypothetical protein
MAERDAVGLWLEQAGRVLLLTACKEMERGLREQVKAALQPQSALSIDAQARNNGRTLAEPVG